MKRLIVMRGLPGSGKSTAAKKEREDLIAQGWECYRVNRDLLRKMLHFDEWSPKNEGVTVDALLAVVRTLLDKKNTGKNRAVIVDDSNLTKRHMDRWLLVSKEAGAEFELYDMETDIETCIQRDARRPDGERVGRLKIVEMAMASGEIPAGTKMVVTDFDGTIANVDHRLEHVKKTPKDWNAFFAGVPHDKPRPEVWEQFQAACVEVEKSLAPGEKMYKIIFSARPERCRQDSEKWLSEHGYLQEVDALIMRPDGDSRPDDEMKRLMFERFLKPYTVVKIFDDRPRVIRLWKELGLDVVDVGHGIEF